MVLILLSPFFRTPVWISYPLVIFLVSLLFPSQTEQSGLKYPTGLQGGPFWPPCCTVHFDFQHFLFYCVLDLEWYLLPFDFPSLFSPDLLRELPACLYSLQRGSWMMSHSCSLGVWKWNFQNAQVGN